MRSRGIAFAHIIIYGTGCKVISLRTGGCNVQQIVDNLLYATCISRDVACGEHETPVVVGGHEPSNVGFFKVRLQICSVAFLIEGSCVRVDESQCGKVCGNDAEEYDNYDYYNALRWHADQSPSDYKCFIQYVRYVHYVWKK